MALKLKKKPVETGKGKNLEADPVAQLIDRIGDLSAASQKTLDKIAKLKLELEPLEKAQAELAAYVNEAFEDSPADNEYFLQGTRYRAKVGKKGTKREITDMEGIKKIMGVKTFMKVATVKLGDVDKYLNPDEKEKVLKVERTTRNVAVEQKNPNT